MHTSVKLGIEALRASGSSNDELAHLLAKRKVAGAMCKGHKQYVRDFTMRKLLSAAI